MIVSLKEVRAYRAGQPVLAKIDLTVSAGERIFVSGENGAGKSTLLALLASRLHPFGNEGVRQYAWDAAIGEDFRHSRRYIAYVSREEQHRLQTIHASSTLGEFLAAHSDGQDFLYREAHPAETERAEEVISRFAAGHLRSRRLATLSLGEMRLALILRAFLFPRRLYVLDEPFTSLSPGVLGRVLQAIEAIPREAAVVMTGHDDERVGRLRFNRYLHIASGRLSQPSAPEPAKSPQVSHATTGAELAARERLICCRGASFYHDFTRIFHDLSFTLCAGERVLLTGENGSGKTTLLRIMHGDFYPAFGSGTLEFLGPLAHTHKADLWNRVQLVAAQHFTYFPSYMTVLDVLATRLSGSLYDYPQQLPPGAIAVANELAVATFFARRFAELSEGEKTRVLIARAFLLPAPVYLIDEGFVALSEAHFAAALARLNALAPDAAVVIAANERAAAVTAGLQQAVKRWHIADGRLSTAL